MIRENSEEGSWGRNSLVHIRPKIVSTTGSSPTITVGSCQTTMHIYKDKRMVCLSYRSEFEVIRNFCVPQPLAARVVFRREELPEGLAKLSPTAPADRSYLHDQPVHRPCDLLLKSYGTTIIGARQNATFCPVGSSTVTWQLYSPGAS